jgi:Domain of unknown function (DUF6460)
MRTAPDLGVCYDPMDCAKRDSGADAEIGMRGDGCMDRQQFFGDSVSGTLVRLVLLSIVVGVVFSVLGITPFNLIERIEQLARRILDLGFDAIRSAFAYFLLGAVVVIPIWFIMRLLKLGRPRERR